MTEAAKLLAIIYVPMMWVLVVVSGGIGALGVLAPSKLKGTVGLFTKNRPVRILGVLLMVVGAEMFIRGSITTAPLLVKTLGVILFIDGGVCLFIPTFSVITAEWCMDRTEAWHRLAGLLALVLAYLFFLATKLPLPPA
jgi:hypothetical protein